MARKEPTYKVTSAPAFPNSMSLFETFSIRFFMVNSKRQTWRCHVTKVLRSRLQFAVLVWKARRASSGKWFTARFFAIKNCTASRFKARDRFLHPPVTCQWDCWTRINEFFLFFRQFVHTNPYVCALVLIQFQIDAFFFNENAQRISVPSQWIMVIGLKGVQFREKSGE